MDCVRVKRSFQVHELAMTRRRSEIKENMEIPAEETYNDISFRVDSTGYTDSDWAGCKLTSGGVILHG